MILLVGHSLDINTIHLTTSGLYVSLPRYNQKLPATITEMEDVVSDLVVSLLTVRARVYFIGLLFFIKLLRYLYFFKVTAR